MNRPASTSQAQPQFHWIAVTVPVGVLSMKVGVFISVVLLDERVAEPAMDAAPVLERVILPLRSDRLQSNPFDFVPSIRLIRLRRTPFREQLPCAFKRGSLNHRRRLRSAPLPRHRCV